MELAGGTPNNGESLPGSGNLGLTGGSITQKITWKAVVGGGTYVLHCKTVDGDITINNITTTECSLSDIHAALTAQNISSPESKTLSIYITVSDGPISSRNSRTIKISPTNNGSDYTAVLLP